MTSLFLLGIGPNRMSRLWVYLAFVLVAGSGDIYAQSASNVLAGIVVDQSGGAIADAEVSAAAASGGARRRTRSGPEGRFAFAGLPPGRYAITVRHPGFADVSADASVDASGAPADLRIEMQVAGLSEQVSVGAASTAPPTAAPSVIEVSPLEVRGVAGAGENIFRVLQTLPGVAAVNDFDSRLSVRGGGPDQNLTIMDGIEIHNPYRLFGLTSAFNPETVERFELTAGGFSAKYGDRLSSILVVENRDGTTAAPLAATAALALTDGNLVAEGRLPGSSGSSWLVTGRRTYYDLVAERIVDSDLPSFADLQGRAVWEMTPGRRLTLMGLRSREGTDASFDGDVDGERVSLQSGTRNDLGAATFASSLGSMTTSRTTVSWYRNSENIDFDGAFRNEAQRSNRPDEAAVPFAAVLFTRNVAVRDVAVRQELAMTFGPRHLVETGFETHALTTSWAWKISGDRNPNAPNGSSGNGGTGLPALLDSTRRAGRVGGWLTDRWSLTPSLRLEPGVRVDWTGLADELTLSPRLALVADAGRTRLRLAGGQFTQSPGYEKLLQSDYFVDLSNAETLRLRSERAWHAVASVERRIASGLTGRVEAYFKRFDRLLVGRLETPAAVAARVAEYDFPTALSDQVPDVPQVTSIPGNDADGRAYGVEIYAARQATSAATRLTGWMSYTWGTAETAAYGRTFLADYDRPHALSLVSTYRVSRLLQIGTTVRVQSGFPRTPALGVRVASVEDTADADGDGNRSDLVPARDAAGFPIWTPDFGDSANLNTGRLPVFARVDLRATFLPRWANNRWQLYAEVINLLNRDNASSLDTELTYDPASDRPRLTTVRSGRLPLLPSFGIRYRF